MGNPRLRIAALALLLGLALTGWYYRANLDPRPKVQMADQPCPPPAQQADEVKPVKFDWVELCRYTHENARLLANGAPIDVVFFGDSITEYWAAADPTFFTGGRINRGISGQTSQQLVLRFRQDVLGLRPKIVVMQAGVNDILGNTGLIGPDAYIANFETLIDLAQLHGIGVVIGGLPAASGIPGRDDIAATARTADLNRRLRDLARRRGVPFADYHAALAGPDGKPRAGLSDDGVHLTPAGYAAIRPVAERAMAQARGRLSAAA